MIGFLLGPLGRYGLMALGVVAFIALFAWDQQQRGASKVVAKIEATQHDAVSKATRARSSSQSSSGGVRDPYSSP